jgi:hypothetical protein
MKKIDILNFITSFRKAPNEIKSYSDILANFNGADEAQFKVLLEELKQSRVLKEIDSDGKKLYQVVTK